MGKRFTASQKESQSCCTHDQTEFPNICCIPLKMNIWWHRITAIFKWEEWGYEVNNRVSSFPPSLLSFLFLPLLHTCFHPSGISYLCLSKKVVLINKTFFTLLCHSDSMFSFLLPLVLQKPSKLCTWTINMWVHYTDMPTGVLMIVFFTRGLPHVSHLSYFVCQL